MSKKQSSKLFQASLIKEAAKQSFFKLSPAKMFRNPVMFAVWTGTLIMIFVCAWIASGEKHQGSLGYNITVTVVLFITVLFANFAEAIAEARGKAQADSLRKTREETPAKVYVDGNITLKSSASLKKGEIFLCETGDIIPTDGEIIEGIATVDESAITG